MKKTINLGLVNYYGKKLNATVEIEYKNKKEGQKVFSVSGSIGNECGGQCLDTIAEYINTPLFNEILRLWNEYHLNDMHPECEHQNELGWMEIARTKVKVYHFSRTTDLFRTTSKIEKDYITKLKNGETVTLSDHEKFLMNLKWSFTQDTDILPDEIKEYYKLEKTEEKTLGWLYEKDHPQGILSIPCPVCGYKYGNAWNYVAIPEADEKIIESGS